MRAHDVVGSVRVLCQVTLYPFTHVNRYIITDMMGAQILGMISSDGV